MVSQNSQHSAPSEQRGQPAVARVEGEGATSMQATVWLSTSTHAGHAATQPRARRPLAAADAARRPCFCCLAQITPAMSRLFVALALLAVVAIAGVDARSHRHHHAPKPGQSTTQQQRATRPSAPCSAPLRSAPLGHALSCHCHPPLSHHRCSPHAHPLCIPMPP